MIHLACPSPATPQEEMMDIADYLHRTLEAREDAAALAKIREEVHAFSRKFPLPF